MSSTAWSISCSGGADAEAEAKEILWEAKMAVLKREDAENRGSPAIAMTDVHTILGPESRFQGTLSFEGTVRIDGHFKGDVNTNDVLVVGQGAKVEAEIKVGSIVVNGEV